MTDFEPFDKEYEVDKSVLTESVPTYLDKSLKAWIAAVVSAHEVLRRNTNGMNVLGGANFLHPLEQTFRRDFSEEPRYFYSEIFSDVKLLRNILSYFLQNICTISEAKELEIILERCSSAYAVEFIKGEEIHLAIKTANGKPMFEQLGCRLVYRVAPVVKQQAEEILCSEPLISDAWDAYYGMNYDDEKTVVRCTDALSGLLRDNYFPDEKRPVFGTMLAKMKQSPEKYSLPADTIYDNKKLLESMNEFSKIRGNHQKGTGRKPTHEEARFVLHFTIMLYQLLRSKI